MSKHINVTDGSVLESLNNKVDLDGGNYPGSGLSRMINVHHTGINMFDPVVKDHILTYEESRGLAPQGTWVYKTAVTGEHYGYEDFYNRCLEEYKNSTNILESKTVTKTWKSPSDFNGISFSGNIVVDGNVTIGHGETFYGKVTGTFSIKISFDRLVELRGINIGGDFLEGSSKGFGVHIIYSPDGENGKILYQDVQGMSASATSWNVPRTWETVTAQTVTIMISSSSSTPLALLLRYIKVTATYEDIESIVQHQNGHVFYNVLIQDVVDNIFASTGTAWMYGIDEENERIFLPRDKSSETSSHKLHICVGNMIADTSWVDVVTQVQNGTQDIENTRQNVLNDIENIRKTGVASIETAKNNSVAAVEVRGAELRSKMALQMFDTISKDHILSYEETPGLALQGTAAYKNAIAGERYGYPDFYNKCLLEYQEGQDITINGATCRKHPNGHIYYEMKDKQLIDQEYTNTGVGHFYGIDTINECIHLPRVTERR